MVVSTQETHHFVTEAMPVYNKISVIIALIAASLSGGCSSGTGLFFSGPAQQQTGQGDSAFVWYKVQSVETSEGEGARVKRLFPNRNHKHHDPFVLMDEFFVSPEAGFPKHPHKGFEAITYMLDGAFRHKDNLGYDSVVKTGGAQRFSAGKGIVHSEMPGSDTLSHGLQLWIRLPDSLQDTEPTYQQVAPPEIPVTKKDGITIRTISENNKPVSVQSEISYHHYTFSDKKEYSFNPQEGHQGLVYILQGKIISGEDTIKPDEAIFFKDQPNRKLTVTALKGTEFVVITGKPHHEKIKLKGSFVE